MAYQTNEQLRRRDAWIRQQTIERIRSRVMDGPPGWEDITKKGYAYHETMDSMEVDWIIAILEAEMPTTDALKGKIVHHIDGDPDNNDPENLELRDAK